MPIDSFRIPPIPQSHPQPNYAQPSFGGVVSAMSGAGVDGTPSNYKNLQLWYDASNESTLTKVRAVRFISGLGYGLAGSTTVPSNLELGAAATIEFTKNQINPQLDQCYVAKWNSTSANSSAFFIQSGGAANGNRGLRVFIAKAATGATFAACDTPTSAAEWTHAAIVYDGSQATDFDLDGATATAKVRVYLDGTAVALTSIVATVPTALFACTGTPLTLGKVYGGALAPRDLDAVMSRTRIWNAALSGATISQLYNGGNPLWHSQLGTLNNANLIVSYDLDDTGSTYIDKKQGYNMTGKVEPCTVLTRIADQSGNAIHQTANFGYAPLWFGGGLGKGPYIKGFGSPGNTAVRTTHYMNCTTSNWAPNGSGTLFHVSQLDAVQGADFDHCVWCTADVATDTEYFFPMYWETGGVLTHSIRMRTTAGQPNGRIDDTTAAALSTPYVTSWQGRGIGDALSHELRVNGSLRTITYGAVNPTNQHNKWIGDIAARDNVTLLTMKRSDGATNRPSMRIGEIVVYGPALADSDRNTVEGYLRRKWGI